MPLLPVNNETELLEKVIEGNEKAFANLFYSYHNELAEFVLGLTGSIELTEEIIQDVFIKVWEMRATLISIKHFTGWLFILARNITLNSIRKKSADFKKRSEYEKYVYLANGSEDPYNNIPNEHYEIIKKAIEQLPDQQKKVFSMRHEEGLSYSEISEALSISKETVKKYLQIALKSVCVFIKCNISYYSRVVLLIPILIN